jgi:hypothetical protein
MSSLTADSWADSGKVVWDTLDTCVVEIPNNGITKSYSIDMQSGLVIRFNVYGGPESAQHQYFYGYDNGIYFLQKVSFSAYDTSIQNYGGYEFSNIRINGEPVMVITAANRKPERFIIQWIDRRQGTIRLSGITGPARAALFDIRGRRVTPGYCDVNGSIGIDRLCPIGGCPAGPLLLRIENGALSKVLPVSFVR